MATIATRSTTLCPLRVGKARCKRLPGHRKACSPIAPKGLVGFKASRQAAPKGRIVAVKGVEVLSADRYEVQPLITVLPEAPSERMVADTTNGQLRTAKRRRAPRTQLVELTVTEALGL